MKKQHKIRAVHNGKSGEKSGFIGLIPDEETYQKVKNGEADWKSNVKPRMTNIQIPKELFYRLMTLDIGVMEDESESPIQKLISYIDEAFKKAPFEGTWVNEKGDIFSVDVPQAQKWWNECMKPELVRLCVEGEE